MSVVKAFALWRIALLLPINSVTCIAKHGIWVAQTIRKDGATGLSCNTLSTASACHAGFEKVLESVVVLFAVLKESFAPTLKLPVFCI